MEEACVVGLRAVVSILLMIHVGMKKLCYMYLSYCKEAALIVEGFCIAKHCIQKSVWKLCYYLFYFCIFRASILVSGSCPLKSRVWHFVAESELQNNLGEILSTCLQN